MNGDLTISTGGVTTLSTGVEKNHFEVAFQPARPALDAVIALWKPLAWLTQRQRPLLDIARAGQHGHQAIQRCELIPKDPDMYRMQKLFEQAEHEAAPEGWAHIAIALMLDSVPGTQHLSDAFRHGIVDSMFNDPETWEGYSPGFSAPVIARSVREARRLDGLPSPGSFVAMSARQRAWFRHGQNRIKDLIEIRQNAEDILISLATTGSLISALRREKIGISNSRPLREAAKRGPSP
jgi:hypothetical protein